MMRPLGWFGIVRLGLVQSAIGAIVMLATSLLNRVMVVEYALPAALPAGLVAWHYAVQVTRPVWGHGSDGGRRRAPWIVAGLLVLGTGVMLAVAAVAGFAARAPWALPLAIGGFAMIGAGVGAAGTSLLALLAIRVAPERRAGAAALTWIMMIAGIVVAAGVAGTMIEPYSLPRLIRVVAIIAGAAILIATTALIGIEGRAGAAPAALSRHVPFATALRAMLADDAARRFTAFVFLSMFAYSMQELILEPFAGLRFGFTPGQSTKLAGVLHAGVLAGMVVVGAGGSLLPRGRVQMRHWIAAGCVASALALVGLVLAARHGPPWPLSANIAALGVGNGMFAVSAIGAMMGLAGADGANREGMRMGVWGAAQAIAFACGGLAGAIGLDLGRAWIGSVPVTFMVVFSAQAALFLVAASFAPGGAARPRAAVAATA